MMEWFFWPTRVSYANDPVGTALVGIVALALAAEALASPAYSREDWFLPVQLAFALDGLAAMALALWLGYVLGGLFRRKPRAAA